MNAERLLRHYEQIADAPVAVGRLRQLVLDLAVLGKLVPQDASDRAQDKALSLARQELSNRAKATGRLRFSASAPVTADEIAGRLPLGWVAARINDTGLYINGLAFKPSDWKPAGHPIIRIQNLSDESREFNYAQGDFPDEVLVRTGDILVSWSATLDAYLWKRDTGVLNQHIFRVIEATGLTESAFLLLLLKRAIRDLSDSVHAHGLVMTHINRGPFLNHVVWIPPLAEQRRIVGKVDELMALCDRLEVARAGREAARDRLSAASLACLNSPDPEAIADDARFALDALPALTARPDQIKQFRQTILNLAVRGQLVTQITADGSADLLLKRLTSTRTARNRSDAVLAEDGGPYAIPDSWRWATLDQVIVEGPQNGVSPKPSTLPNAPRAITLTATTSGTFNPSHFKRVELVVPPDSDLWLRDGDLLFQRGNTREYVGMAAIYSGPPQSFLYPDLMIRVRVSPEVSLRYIHLVAVAPPTRAYMAANATGAQLTMPKINQSTLVALPIPLPPRAEQNRIVAMVEELMSLCDQLEGSLIAGEGHRLRLLDALLHKALEPAEELEDAA